MFNSRKFHRLTREARIIGTLHVTYFDWMEQRFRTILFATLYSKLWANIWWKNSYILKRRRDIWVQFPNPVPVTILLDRTSKFRRQVKQARLPKWPLHWMGLHIYYNGFTSTVKISSSGTTLKSYANMK